MSDADESVRKQIGRSINKLGRNDVLTIANASIYFHGKPRIGQLGLHCVGWHHSNLSKAELSNGHSATVIELTPLEHYDDGVLFIFSGTVQEDFATPETNNFEEFRVRLIDHKNQVSTKWFPVWVWGEKGDRQILIHQPPHD